MNILDIIISILLISFVFVGYKKGFISELIQIIALITALFTAAPIGKWIGSILASNYSINKDLMFFASSIAAFLIIFSFIIIVGKIFSPVPAPDSILSIGNKVSGGILGLIKGFCAATVLVLLVRITPFASFITDNIDYVPRAEKGIYDQSVLKRAIANVKEGAIYLASDSVNKEIFQQALKDSVFAPEIDSVGLVTKLSEKKTKAKLGYLAYKLSTTMDPALESYKKYLFEKIDQTLESATSISINNDPEPVSKK